MNLYEFGANDERGKLIELHMPAETEEEAWIRLKQLVGEENEKRFWINDVREYL